MSLANFTVRILTGTGNGQTVVIQSNTSTVITVIGTWSTIPDNTSTYEIVAILANGDHITGNLSFGSTKTKNGQ